MRAHKKQLIEWILLVVFWLSVIPGWSQEKTPFAEENTYITVSGVVKDKQNRKTLEYVNVSVPGRSVGTVTNADGEFSLKIEDAEMVFALEISHIGYHNNRVRLDKEHLSDLKIYLTPHANMLNEIVVYAHNPRLIVEEAIRKIPVNYSNKNNMLTGFYRETVQKGRRYINISEAIIDVYKTSYEDMTTTRDRVQVLKGRRLLSQKVSRQQYVISFRPRVVLPYALYYGKLYIDRDKLSFTRAEFSLSMDNKVKAVQAILAKKPYGLRFKPQELSFLVTYKDMDGKTYLNYIRNRIRFKCDWKRKLFSTGYTVLSEMVATDRKENNVAIIPGKMAFHQKDAFYDKVDEYWSEDFWGSYNIIEPTESLENAVHKLKKQSR